MSKKTSKIDAKVFSKLRQDPYTLEDLADSLNITIKDARKSIKRLENKNIKIEINKINGGYKMYNIPSFPYPKYGIETPLKCDGIFGIVSDTHMGSRYEALDKLYEHYDNMYDAGVKHVLHAGDCLDGYLVYKNQINDLKVWGQKIKQNILLRIFQKERYGSLFHHWQSRHPRLKKNWYRRWRND